MSGPVLASTCLALALMTGAVANPLTKPEEGLAELIDVHCIDCHGRFSTKGKLDLRSVAEHLESAPLRSLRLARDRIRGGAMPPDDAEQPTAEQRATMVRLISTELERREPQVTAGRPTLRRINRVEYRNSVRELFGVDVDTAIALPADDVGEGFDHIGDVLSMPPTLLEKYLDVAERVALKAWPDVGAAMKASAEGRDLRLRGGGQVNDQGANVWSAGAAFLECELPRDGEYRISFRAFGDQAGEEPVKVAVRTEASRLAHFDIPERRGAPGSRTATVTLSAGVQRIGVEFLNDFFEESRPQGERDRNLHVLSIAIEGPVDQVSPTARTASYAGSEPHLGSFIEAVASRAFRRSVTAEEVNELGATVAGATGSEASWPQHARAVVAAVLVDPRFLFHVERDAEQGTDRALTGEEVAARLASFLWRSLPDDALSSAARGGGIDTTDGLRAATERLLDDPRSLSLAEQFAQQWLFIRSLDERQPDPTLFPGAERALLADMRAETTLFVDAIIRENRPVTELLSADWSFLNARLAKHYGLDGVEGDWLRRVRIADVRVPGLLGHGSVLVATSNPTRTSPVKRGKWVLEAMLDEPPPPPPPGVPLLPEVAHDGGRPSVRAMLERHRADPACAGCHRQMDAIGLALEPLDAVGRWRTHDGQTLIEAKGDLPDGRHFDGPRELASLLAHDPSVIRSVVRHLFVYALGRPMREEDHLIVDRITRELGESPSFRQIVHAIVATDQFRRRSPAPTGAKVEARAGRSEAISP